MLHVDLNSDLGESYGAFEIGRDADVIPLITSANIGCGYHGGDPAVMAATVAAAIRHGVGIGAHPSYPDLVGFGRRLLACSEEEVYGYVLYQVGALHAFAKAKGTVLSHVKPHGALNNYAYVDLATARGIVRAVRDFDPALPLFAMPGSVLGQEAQAMGQPVLWEVFADRAYQRDGSLVSRSLPGAVIHDPEVAVRQVITMVSKGYVRALDGTDVPIKAETVCVHGDNPAAVALIRSLRQRLPEAGISLTPLAGFRPALG